MIFYLITFRSITFAQHGERILRKEGIDCALIRTPKQLQERGCGYCLRVRPAAAQRAVELLRQSRVSFGKLYALRENGETEEREL